MRGASILSSVAATGHLPARGRGHPANGVEGVDSAPCESRRRHFDIHNERRGKALFLFSEECGETERPLDEQLLQSRLDETVEFWRRWSGKSRYHGRWRETVSRSALTLKLMQDDEYGSIVAAPTFGLPEHPGGERNWDYRYTWLRDASFTLYAMMRLGYMDEAQQFQKWLDSLMDYDSEQGPLQVLYGIDGRREIPESTLAIYAAIWTRDRYVSATLRTHNCSWTSMAR